MSPAAENKLIGLRVEVATLRGARQGVARLLETLQKHQAGATFYFNVGKDRSGRLVRRLARKGWLRKAVLTGAIRHYGASALLQGTVLPSPDMGARCAQILQSVHQAGFETGVLGRDPIGWEEGVENGAAGWAAREMADSCKRYEEIVGEPATTFAAPGWCVSVNTLRQTQRLGFAYCSDTRGRFPFIPVYNGEIVACPQVPTTLPTLDELMAQGVDNLAQRLLQLTAGDQPAQHVYTVRATYDGGRLFEVFESLLDGWHEQGYRLVSLGRCLEAAASRPLPKHEILFESTPGRPGKVAVQGPEFLADMR